MQTELSRKRSRAGNSCCKILDLLNMNAVPIQKSFAKELFIKCVAQQQCFSENRIERAQAKNAAICFWIFLNLVRLVKYVWDVKKDANIEMGGKKKLLCTYRYGRGSHQFTASQTFLYNLCI